jgi:hypothetical protein
VIKSRRTRWAGHVKSTDEMRNAYEIVVGKADGKRLLGNPSVNRRIILKRIIKKCYVRVLLD